VRELAAIVGSEHVEEAVRVGDTAQVGVARALVRPRELPTSWRSPSSA
jgi:hypothetical protein